MTESLPEFRYHPNPIATGVVELSDSICICCNRERGFIYKGPVYSTFQLRGRLCPWCIADGSAAAKYHASFADSYSLTQEGIPDSIIEEVNLRTPSYISWQQENWLVHCGDACEFRGDATSEDLALASSETKSDWMRRYRLSEKDWNSLTNGYRPGGDVAFYKFVCRHCRHTLLGWDCC
jgi:uncharacterized protein